MSRAIRVRGSAEVEQTGILEVTRLQMEHFRRRLGLALWV